MSAAGRTGTDARGAVSDAEFVRLVATADGDALAATGLFARALDAAGVPYQASLAAVPDPPATDADCTVAVGSAGGDVTLSGDSLALAAGFAWLAHVGADRAMGLGLKYADAPFRETHLQRV